MKNSILLIAVASVFALASCGGEKHSETSTVESSSTSIDSSAVISDTTTSTDTVTTMSADSSVTK